MMCLVVPAAMSLMATPPSASVNRNSVSDTQVPFNFLGLNLSGSTTSASVNRAPRTLGPVSGGVMMTTARATRPMTAPMTRSAMAMPFQLRWLGVAATNS